MQEGGKDPRLACSAHWQWAVQREGNSTVQYTHFDEGRITTVLSF